jgi:hypothetical protein
LQLTLVVLATAAWVDFTKDVFRSHPENDVIQVFNRYGFETESERWPLRLTYAALSAAAGYEVGKGMVRIFRKTGRKTARRRNRIQVVATPAFFEVMGAF